MPDIIQFIANDLQDSPYAPWVNFLLFLLFVVAIAKAIFLLLGRDGRQSIVNMAKSTRKRLLKRKGYAPEAEKVRSRVAPYIELMGNAYFALVGLYSAILVGLAVALTIGHAPAWATFLGVVWVLVSLIYARVNLEDATWAYHKIRARRD